MERLERELAGQTTTRHPLTGWEDVRRMEQRGAPATTCDSEQYDGVDGR